MELVNCVLCGANEPSEVGRYHPDRYLTALGVAPPTSIKVMCGQCGHVYANPQLDHDEVGRLYRDVYRSSALGYAAERPSPTYLHWKQRKADADYAWLKPRLPARPGSGVLEIGCAEGLLLSRLARDGWRCTGVEPTPAYAAYARDVLGVDVRGEAFEDARFPGERFHLVIALKVLEHVKDPAPMLARIRALLEPGGSVYLTVPNALRPDQELDEFLAASHLALYTASTLGRLLNSVGLTVQTIDESRGSLAALATPGDVVTAALNPSQELASTRRRIRRAIRAYAFRSRVRRTSAAFRQQVKRGLYRAAGAQRGQRWWRRLRTLAGRPDSPESTL
jgi:2-polyprenyl-3-methyl-5-hydroxy-6-metoxy-1,4-benzoquinol methylase